MTQNKITNLEKNYARMDENLKNLSDSLCRIEGKLDKYIDKDEKSSQLFREEMRGTYASKRVELIVYGGVGVSLIWLLSNVLELV